MTRRLARAAACAARRRRLVLGRQRRLRRQRVRVQRQRQPQHLARPDHPAQPDELLRRHARADQLVRQRRLLAPARDRPRRPAQRRLRPRGAARGLPDHAPASPTPTSTAATPTSSAAARRRGRRCSPASVPPTRSTSPATATPSTSTSRATCIAKLRLGVAGRFEDYEDFGSTSDYKLTRALPAGRAAGAARRRWPPASARPSLGQSYFSTVSTNFLAVGGVLLPFEVGTFPVASPVARALGATRPASPRSPSTSQRRHRLEPDACARARRRLLRHRHRGPHRAVRQLHRRAGGGAARAVQRHRRALLHQRHRHRDRAATTCAPPTTRRRRQRPARPDRRLQRDRERGDARRAHAAAARRARRRCSSTPSSGGASSAASPRTACAWAPTGTRGSLFAGGARRPLRRVLPRRPPGGGRRPSRPSGWPTSRSATASRASPWRSGRRTSSTPSPTATWSPTRTWGSSPTRASSPFGMNGRFVYSRASVRF